MTEAELADFISQTIENTAPGEKVSIKFSGKPTPIEVQFVFKGGWKIAHKVSPSENIEFIRGEDDYLNSINIAFLEYNGPREV